MTQEHNRSSFPATDRNPIFHIVLYQPEIPNNTGSVGRTCVGLGAKLWLVRPLGFQISDHKLKRAGLDYWPKLNWEAVDDWSHLLTRIDEDSSDLPRRPDFWFFTKKAKSLYFQREFHRGDVFVYGQESVGLPNWMLNQYASQSLKIPILTEIRSLNLSVSVGITIFEAVRQLSVSNANAGSVRCQ